ncbi:Hypothetical predicted protein [Cloeon dipterum]|uniref:t-SNARE coiled-coil homology domain-containing protein n=1 Tax=Cloeon dipterum TaxID=197152 RepID=A0A8S1C5R3_9INSE|nr:Hypothetical predicted protein [Cloeon dipterum]
MDGGYSLYQNSSGGRGERDFHQLAHSIGSSIQKISKNVTSMQRMVHQLGTPQESSDLKSQLRQLQHYTQQLVKDTNDNIKELSKINTSVPSEKQQWKMQKERLTEEFTTALTSFQEVQRLEAQKEKEDIKRAKQASGRVALNMDGFGGASTRQSEQLIELKDQQEMKQAQLQEEQELRELEERELAIRQLESDIGDVNQIFKDLGQMVYEQGEVIDSIEAHVEKTEIFVSEGTGQLRQASNYQSKARMKKFIFFTCLGLVLAVILAYIIYELSN